MPKKKTVLSKADVQKRAQKIEAIGQQYLQALAEFKRAQKDLLERFIKELENRKIEQIKKSLIK